MKFVFSFLISMSYVCLCSDAFANKVYKWTDAQGVTHYSEQPAMNNKNEVIKPKTGHSDPVNYPSSAVPATTDAKPDAKATEEAEKKAALKDKDRCDTARKNVDSLKTYARIKVKGDNGEYRYLTPEEQQQRLDESKKVVDEACE